MGRGGERASARPPVVGGGGFFLKPPKLVQDTHTHLFIVCHLCFQVGRVLGSRSRSVLASTVSVRLLGCFGVGRFGPGLVLVWSGLSRLSVCLSSCPLLGLRLRLARDAQAKSLAHAIAHVNLVIVPMMSPTIMALCMCATIACQFSVG